MVCRGEGLVRLERHRKRRPENGSEPPDAFSMGHGHSYCQRSGISVQGLFRLRYTGVPATGGLVQPQGAELSSPIITFIGLSSVSLHLEHFIWQVPTLGYCEWASHHPKSRVRLPGMTEARTDETPLPGIALKALDTVCLKPGTNRTFFLNKFKLFAFYSLKISWWQEIKNRTLPAQGSGNLVLKWQFGDHHQALTHYSGY